MKPFSLPNNFDLTVPGKIMPIDPIPVNTDVLYRVEIVYYSVVLDAEREIYGSSYPHLYLRWYPVKRRTKCGARLHYENKFVDLTKVKQWATNTPAEAVYSFISRKDCQIRILVKQLQRAKAEKDLCEQIIKHNL